MTCHSILSFHFELPLPLRACRFAACRSNASYGVICKRSHWPTIRHFLLCYVLPCCRANPRHLRRLQTFRGTSEIGTYIQTYNDPCSQLTAVKTRKRDCPRQDSVRVTTSRASSWPLSDDLTFFTMLRISVLPRKPTTPEATQRFGHRRCPNVSRDQRDRYLYSDLQ